MKIEKQTNYSVNTTYKVEHEPLSKLAKVDNIVNGENLYAVKLDIKEVQSGFYNQTTKNDWSGVVPKEHLDKLIESPEKYMEFVKEFSNKNYVFMATNEYLDYMTKYGDYYEAHGQKQMDVSKHVSSDLLKKMKDENYTLLQNVDNDSYVKVWKDVNGKLYCPPFYLDYIAANLNNEKYDLDAFVEHLIKREDVGMVINRGYSQREVVKCPIADDCPDLSKIIVDIPGYNSEEGKDEYIQVMYYPTQEDLLKILAWKEVKESKVYSVQDFIGQEILGGRVFMKSPLVIEGEPEIPRRKFKK